jgi:hypothetical protein
MHEQPACSRSGQVTRSSGISYKHLLSQHGLHSGIGFHEGTEGWLLTVLTFSSMVPLARKRYTYTRFFWPSRHTRPEACLSTAGFQSQSNSSSLLPPTKLSPHLRMGGKQHFLAAATP